jgi:hypothetical protein
MDEHKPSNQHLKLQRIDVELIAKLNLADFQNAVPMLRELSIVNDADEALESLELGIESFRRFCKPRSGRSKRSEQDSATVSAMSMCGSTRRC